MSFEVVMLLWVFWMITVGITLILAEYLCDKLIFLDNRFLNGKYNEIFIKLKQQTFWTTRVDFDRLFRKLAVIIPITKAGRFFLPYIIVFLFSLEYVCLFYLLVFLFIDVQPIGILFSIVFGLITFLIITGLLVFNKKLQEKTEPVPTLKVLDNIVKVVVFILFLYEIYNLFHDKNSVFSLFHKPILESFSRMKESLLLTIVSILEIFGIVYIQLCLSKYITRRFLNKN